MYQSFGGAQKLSFEQHKNRIQQAGITSIDEQDTVSRTENTSKSIQKTRSTVKEVTKTISLINICGFPNHNNTSKPNLFMA